MARFGGILLFAAALLLRLVFSLWEEGFERYYFQEFFPVVRHMQDQTAPYLPLPGYTLMILLLIAWLFWRKPKPWKKGAAWGKFGLSLVNLAGATGALFLILWGYNYVDIGLASRMNLVTSPYRNQLADAYLAAMDRSVAERAAIPGIEHIPNIEFFSEMPSDQEINEWVSSVLTPFGYPASTSIRVRHIRPDGTLRRLSISGIYNPFTGEANVDNALGPLQRTFTVAHELAHAHGITGEGEANFAAYLACINSGNALAAYAAEYTLWRNLASEVHKHYPPESVAALAANIPELLRKDRAAIWENYYRYKGYFPEVTDAMNDAYLKIQGVEAGTDDYDVFVKLYFDYAQKAALNE